MDKIYVVVEEGAGLDCCAVAAFSTYRAAEEYLATELFNRGWVDEVELIDAQLAK